MKKHSLILFLLIISVLTVIFTFSAYAEALDSGVCGETLTYLLDDTGTLTVSGSGNMYDYDYILRMSDYLILDRELLDTSKNNMIENRLLHMTELAKSYGLSLFAMNVDEYLEFERLLKYKVEYVSGKYLGDSASTPTEIEYTRTRLLSKIIKDAQRTKK